LLDVQNVEDDVGSVHDVHTASKPVYLRVLRVGLIKALSFDAH
jgi:hypothetical protein